MSLTREPFISFKKCLAIISSKLLPVLGFQLYVYYFFRSIFWLGPTCLFHSVLCIPLFLLSVLQLDILYGPYLQFHLFFVFCVQGTVNSIQWINSSKINTVEITFFSASLEPSYCIWYSQCESIADDIIFPQGGFTLCSVR